MIEMIFFCFFFSVLTKSDFEVGDFTYHELSSDNDTVKTVQVVKCSQKIDLSITIPNSVTYESNIYSVVSIASDSFSSSEATQFNSIYFPHTLQDIENSAFKGFINLQKIGYIDENNGKIEDTLPPKLLTLNDFIFDGTSITVINVNNAATMLSAFSNCQNLSRVVLPQKPFELKSTFKSCINLNEVVNFQYCTKINGGFTSCSKLVELEYAPNLDTIGDYSFYECKLLNKFEFNDKITEIGDNAFYGCQGLKSIDLKNIKTIGSASFRACSHITEFKLNKVETLGRFSLAEMQSLTKIELPETLTMMEPYCFMSTPIINITGNPIGITEIESSFAGCKDMINIPIFPSIETIKSSAFQQCYQLKKFECGDKLESIWSNAFDNCRSLEEFITKSNSYTISGEGFINCMSLKNFNFDNVIEVANNAFEGCTSLTNIDFSNSPIIELPWQLFYSCGSLDKIILPPNITEFNILVFEECTINSLTFTSTGSNTLDLTNSFQDFDVELREVIFTSNCKVILDSTFANCQNLSHVVLPQTPYELKSTFKSCTNLSEVDNFQYCTKINGGFTSCSKLSELEYAPNLDTIGDYSFYECKLLNKFEFNDKITEIGNNAFYGCQGLKSIDLKNIKTIGSASFRACSHITEFKLNKVETLGRFSLAEMQSLTKIELPETLTMMEPYCFMSTPIINITGNPIGITEIESSFAGCKDMINIPIFPSIETIKSSAFQQCYQLKKFECGDKLESIWSNAFDNCRSLEEFITKSNSYSISGEGFINCMSLKNFNFDNVIEVANNAFEGCTSLTNIDFSNSPIIELPWQLFYSCGSLDKIILPPNITEFNILVFEECTINSLTFTSTGSNTLDLTNSFQDFDVELREVIFTSNCKVILDSTFANCQNLSHVVLPQTPYELKSTFKSCTNLSEVANFQYCTKINGGFTSCSKLVELEYAPNLDIIGDYSFYECKLLNKFEFNDKITEIGNNAFYGCQGLKNIDLKNIKTIGSASFRACSHITEFKLNKVETLGRFSLAEMQSLTKIELPETLTMMEPYCFMSTPIINITGNPIGITEIESSFAGCKDMINIPIFPSIETIKSSAFQQCYQLKKFECGDKLESIWSNAFDNCRSLEEFITKSNSYTISGEGFINCMSLKNFNFDNVIEVANNAFEGCTSLTNIDFSNSPIIELPWQLFYSCGSLDKIILPPNITEFNILVFEECTINSLTFTSTGSNTLDLTNSFQEFDVELREVIFTSNCKVILDSTFANCQNLSHVVLPQTPYELKSTFKSCTNLSEIENLQYCTKIGDESFYGCSLISIVELSEKVSEIGSFSFYGCQLLHSVSFGNGLSESMTIGSNAFKSCHSLISFEFNLWHTLSIGESAFSDCPLSNQTQLEFGYSDASNKITIMSHAFSSPSISTVVFASPIESLSLDSNSFSDCSGINCVIVDTKFEKEAKVAFDKKVINGDMCPGVPSKHNKKTALIVGIVAGGVGLIVIIVVVVLVIKKKKQKPVEDIEKPIFSTLQ